MSSVLISGVGVNVIICICAVVCRTMAQQQMNPPGTVYTCTHCRKPFSDRSNCRRHMQTQHSLDGQVRGVSAEENDNRFELRHCVDVAVNELLSGNFTQSAPALVSQVRTLLPAFNDREATILVAAAAATTRHLTLLHQTVEVLRRTGDPALAAERDLSRRLAYLAIGPKWSASDAAPGAASAISLPGAVSYTHLTLPTILRV